MIQIPSFKKLREQLINDPLLLKELCIELEIMESDEVSKNPQRLIDSWQSSGFTVTCNIDDDKLTEDEKQIHYANLADKCIKALKEKGFSPHGK